MEGMEQVFDVIIGVFEDDSRPIPQTALKATSMTMSGGKFIYILPKTLATFRTYVFCLFIALGISFQRKRSSPNRKTKN